ncbi:YtxH domain-containing protein [Pseudalkalibacillus sp. SCS-8]|uniref:YtxH domain-containing protein n=1 Tax=Pseudalkalibacillus nanhaiensis TaxID=3115291 RepID=UPI0032DA7522
MTQAVHTPEKQAQRTPTNINAHRQREGSFLWKGIVIGALVGGLAAMIDKNTRRNIQQRSMKLKDQTSSLYSTVREDPSVIINTVKHTMDTTSKALNELSREVKEVVSKIDEVKQNSLETYSSVREVGGELKDVSSKLREAGREITDLDYEDDEHK